MRMSDTPLAGRATVGPSELGVSPLTLGTNVFGWTISPEESFAVLDAFLELGGNSLDSADVYSFWGDGNRGGESERVIGDWMRSRQNRADVVLATKVGAAGGRFGTAPSLEPDSLRQRVEDSLRRLGTETLDLLYLHAEDPGATPEETVGVLDEFIARGMVRHVAVSNYSTGALTTMHRSARQTEGAATPIAVQPWWSLLRRDVEDDLVPACRDLGLGVIPYWGLEKGFLTGKYRTRGVEPQGPRQERHRPMDHLTGRGERILAVLDGIAAEVDATPGAVALAWLLHQPVVPSVIASARTPGQLHDLAGVGTVRLSADQAERLDQASRSWNPG